MGLAKNVLWTDDEKAVFSQINTDRDGMIFCFDALIPPPVIFSQKFIDFAESEGFEFESMGLYQDPKSSRKDYEKIDYNKLTQIEWEKIWQGVSGEVLRDLISQIGKERRNQQPPKMEQTGASLQVVERPKSDIDSALILIFVPAGAASITYYFLSPLHLDGGLTYFLCVMVYLATAAWVLNR